jgi:hypothetical protein
MTKLSGGVCPIVVGEMLYQFTSCTLCIQFCETFTTNFSLHQFRVATKSGCATIIHNIGCTLDLHLDWVVFQPDMVNAFNLMLRGVVFQKLRVTNGDIILFIPFVCAFYVIECPLCYIHYDCEGDVTRLSHLSWEPIKVIP